ncbi:conserved hypothetical protein [Neospora caninum Liverpool]|uniref:Uncharacterized protein n=1 Tax=Neospora caninum (strain Liverpool) TaxID=572307 RepID=F0VQP4_NEOCL|nr:conserved hypothetical protein [Neospora caninum Liverpool]CBZ56041.1 conserved hypothetical protein [Neospora caninum Liverpool]|eukprot:XP_003886067.1 conserved hypothetical protein [Neospora caninum Liverpool]
METVFQIGTKRAREAPSARSFPRFAGRPGVPSAPVPSPASLLAVRGYTPPSKRTWAKQHNKIFTPRPLSERFSPHKLHPEHEWWRERATQPSALFMGFPDLLSLPLRGGHAYINEMDASTLAVVLANVATSPSPYSVSERRAPPTPSLAALAPPSFSPVHLPQHLDTLLLLLGRQAAATAADATDTALAFLFRGCAEAGIAERSVVCTLLGRVETRLPRMMLPDCLVLMEALRPGLPAVYRHPRFVASLVRHVALLVQFRGAESDAEELCDLAHLLVFAAQERHAALLQSLAMLLIQGKRQTLNVTSPVALARAMEAFAAARDAINAPLLDAHARKPETERRSRHASDLFCASPLLRAREPSVYAPPSALLLLSLLAPLVQAVHRAEKGAPRRRGREFDAEREASERDERLSRKNRDSVALTEAAARAADAVAAETEMLKNRESTLTRGLLRCLERVDDNRGQLSPESICKVLYAAVLARTAPSRLFFPDLLKRLGDQLGACTPEDLSRALFALVKLSSASSSLHPRCRDLLPPLLATVLAAVKSSLPLADVSTLARLHSAAASAAVASLETKKEELRSLAEDTSRLMHARLEEASPTHLTVFLRHLDLCFSLSSAEFREALVAQAILRLYFFDQEQLSRLLESVTRLAASSPRDEKLLVGVDEILRRVEEEATAEQAFFSPESSLRILVSLVRHAQMRPKVTEERQALIAALCRYLTGFDSVSALPASNASQPADERHRFDPKDIDGSDLSIQFLFADDEMGQVCLPDQQDESFLDDRDAAGESRLQALSAASYIHLLRALSGLGVQGGAIISRVAHLLDMKRYDLTEAQQEVAAEICASLGLQFQQENRSGSGTR